MTEKEAVNTMVQGFNLFATHSRMIAMLPIEEWLQSLERAETLGPIVDPTLFKAYIHSERTAVLKDILHAALPLKRAVLKHQPAVKAEMERERKSN